MRIAMVTGLLMGLASSAAEAGSLAAAADGAATYSFNRCTRPPEPDLSVDPALKGRDAVKARNEKVKLYNFHVGEMNAYMLCLSNEAERDLQDYYAAVSASLEAEQKSVTDALAATGKSLEVRFKN
jgi:hypothetical protein